MKMSRRAKRMEKNHSRQKQSGLNLVSLMDIFTILVFFLLVNSSNVQQLPKKEDIRLPTSVAKKVPEETLVIAVSPTSIIVQGREVARIEDVVAGEESRISGLEEELLFQASKTMVFDSSGGEEKGKSVTILGDETINYQLLRKILATCREANYTQIAFAAIQKAKSGEDT